MEIIETVLRYLFKPKKFMTVKTKYKDMGELVKIKNIFIGDVGQAIQGEGKIWYLSLKEKTGKWLIKNGHAEEISKEKFLRVVKSHYQ